MARAMICTHAGTDKNSWPLFACKLANLAPQSFPEVLPTSRRTHHPPQLPPIQYGLEWAGQVWGVLNPVPEKQ